VVIPKGTTGEWRFCVDFRRLNAVTRKDSYPLPRIDDLLDRLGQDKAYFTILECRAAFWVIPMARQDQCKTAFITRNGLYEFTSMPFGLTGAPACLQRLVDRLLRGYDFCSIYLDDVLIYSATFEDHLIHLRTVFETFRAANFRGEPEKVQPGAGRAAVLGPRHQQHRDTAQSQQGVGHHAGAGT
jgi:hypothetical protein